MSEELFVRSEHLNQAFIALLPFTSKAKEEDRVDGAYAMHEVIHLNITQTGKLAVSAFSKTGDWAIALLPLADYEGAITDFAIHRDEALLFTKTFRPRKDQENLLRISIDHTESEAKGKDQTGTYIEYRRSTMLRISEEGQLFGARISQFAGADARHLTLPNRWAQVASEAVVTGETTREFRLTPEDISPLSKACRIYGTPLLSMSGYNLLARFAGDFIACCRIDGAHDERKTDSEHSVDSWAEEIFTASEFFPHHTVREQLTRIEEVPVTHL